MLNTIPMKLSYVHWMLLSRNWIWLLESCWIFIKTKQQWRYLKFWFLEFDLYLNLIFEFNRLNFLHCGCFHSHMAMERESILLQEWQSGKKVTFWVKEGWWLNVLVWWLYFVWLLSRKCKFGKPYLKCLNDLLFSSKEWCSHIWRTSDGWSVCCIIWDFIFDCTFSFCWSHSNISHNHQHHSLLLHSVDILISMCIFVHLCWWWFESGNEFFICSCGTTEFLHSLCCFHSHNVVWILCILSEK